MDAPKFNVGDEVVLLESISDSYIGGLRCRVVCYATTGLLVFNEEEDRPHYWVVPLEGVNKESFFVYPEEIDYFFEEQENVDLKDWL